MTVIVLEKENTLSSVPVPLPNGSANEPPDTNTKAVAVPCEVSAQVTLVSRNENRQRLTTQALAEKQRC